MNNTENATQTSVRQQSSTLMAPVVAQSAVSSENASSFDMPQQNSTSMVPIITQNELPFENLINDSTNETLNETYIKQETQPLFNTCHEHIKEIQNTQIEQMKLRPLSMTSNKMFDVCLWI